MESQLCKQVLAKAAASSPQPAPNPTCLRAQFRGLYWQDQVPCCKHVVRTCTSFPVHLSVPVPITIGQPKEADAGGCRGQIRTGGWPGEGRTHGQPGPGKWGGISLAYLGRVKNLVPGPFGLPWATRICVSNFAGINQRNPIHSPYPGLHFGKPQSHTEYRAGQLACLFQRRLDGLPE